MKKLLLLLLIVVTTTFTTFAQPNNLVNAVYFMQNGELDKAKEYIDKAAVHVKTMEKSKTWKYRGDIYYRIFSSMKPEYKDLSPNPAGIAFESYIKTKKLYEKDKRVDISDIDQKLRIMQNVVLNRGVANYNEKKYELAYSKFETSAEISIYLGAIDSLAAYNCALASERGGNVDRAITWYRNCIVINYRAPDCCSIIIQLLNREKREKEANAQMKECRTKYPDDHNLIITELNYFLKNGNYIEAIKNLHKAIEFEPNNSRLHFALGTAQEKLGKNSEAINSYLKALELDSNYFDASYNLGALYFNQAVEVNNKANNELDTGKANILVNEATKVFKQAIPYLEKARALDPNDINTLNSLLALYARINDAKMYQEIKDALGK